ncbi:MAG: TetR family transcriptional regulator [Polyangia bacterium]
MSDEAKGERRQTIVAAAAQLLDELPYDQITVATVAERLGLAKGTLYLYFPTKEGLFLALLEDELAAWFAALRERLAERRSERSPERSPERKRDAAAPGLTPEQLAERIVDSLELYPRLPRLLTVLHSVLERNVPAPEVVAFKQQLRDEVGVTAALIEERLPALRRGQGAVLLLRLHALTIGAFQMTDVSAAVRAALDDESAGLAVFDLSFGPFLRGTLRALIAGMSTSTGTAAAPRRATARRRAP